MKRCHIHNKHVKMSEHHVHHDDSLKIKAAMQRPDVDPLCSCKCKNVQLDNLTSPAAAAEMHS